MKIRIFSNDSLSNIIFICFLFYIFSVFILNSIDIFNFDLYHDGFRQIYYYRYSGSNDYIGDFYRQVNHPILYEFIMNIPNYIDINEIIFHRVINFILYFGIIISCFFIFNLRSDIFLSILSVSVVVLHQVLLERVNSINAHSFGYIMLIWCIIFLSRRYYILLGCITVLSASLYPPVSIIIGFSFFISVVFNYVKNSESIRECITPIFVMVISGIFSLFFLYLYSKSVDGYGEILEPLSNTDLYPENGAEGRAHFSVTNPFVFSLVSLFRVFFASEISILGLYAILAFSIISIYGLIKVFEEKIEYILIFIVSSLIIYLFFNIYYPGISYRFAYYPINTVCPFLFAFGATRLIEKMFYSSDRKSMYVVLLIASVMITPGNAADDGISGYIHSADRSDQQLMRFLKETEDYPLVAAWTNSRVVDFIPYAAGVPTLTSMKLHYAKYVDFTLEMRRRWNGTIDAYLAREMRPVAQLHCDFGAKYLVVERADFQVGAEPVEYFAPFDKRIEMRMEDVEPQDLYLASPPAHSIVFENEKYQIIDLEKLSSDLDEELKQSDGQPCVSL